jgi:hypothetical protein
MKWKRSGCGEQLFEGIQMYNVERIEKRDG